MLLRLMCGFLEARQRIPDFVLEQDRCRPITWEGDGAANAEQICTGREFREDWRPDFFLLRLGFAPVPSWIWALPLPIVAVVEDLDSLWHHHRLCLPRFALALASPTSAACLQRSGLQNVRELGGLEYWLEDARCVDQVSQPGNRATDIDLLVVGLSHPFVDRSGMARMRMWARLGERYRVLCTQANGEELAQQIWRARLVVVRGADRDRNWIETCTRAARVPCYVEEEVDAVSVTAHLDEGEVYVGCNGELISGRAGSPSYGVWARMLEIIEAEWECIRKNTPHEVNEVLADSTVLLARCQHLLASGPHGDSSLIGDLSRALAKQPDNPALHAAMGLATLGYAHGRGKISGAEVSSALEEFRRALALDLRQPVTRLNMVEALGFLGQKEMAAAEARLALAYLDQTGDEVLLMDDPGHVPPIDRSQDEFAEAWEQAGLRNAGNAVAEATDKKAVLRWRLHQLLADWTGTINHYFEAALAYPQSSTSRAALGCALAKTGKVADALPHLRLAVDANPLDVPAARNLYKALADLGDAAGQRRVARDLWLLAHMVPGLVREAWFENPPSADDELASIVLCCGDEAELTHATLESVVRHTHTPFEIVLVVNESQSTRTEDIDPTSAREQPEVSPALPRSIQVLSEQALGHFHFKGMRIVRQEGPPDPAAACHLGLAHAKGSYLVVLEAGAMVTEQWLERMIACSLAAWPRVGMVGAVANRVPPSVQRQESCNGEARGNPQVIDMGRNDPQALADHARMRLAQFQGKACPVEQLADFCLLMRRDVYETLSPGMLECSFNAHDWCTRARAAGFDLMVALDVFIARPCPQPTLPLVSEGLPDAGSHEPHSRPRVSLCMIVKDEEENLPDCLASVTGLMDEIIIVDTGSTDRTRAIAEEAGALVFDFPWVDDFAAARNESLRHATGEWIFWMDADDRLDEENREKLGRLFESLPSGNQNVAFVMKCLCLPDLESGTATVVDHVRLFRNDKHIRWKYRVHEQILAAVCQAGGHARWSDVVVHHTGYQDCTRVGPKLERALRLLQMDLADNPEDAFTLFNIGWTTMKMGATAEAVPYLQCSLEKSRPNDSIVRKALALLVQCHKALGQMDQALGVCRLGRRLCPDDAEILFEEGCLTMSQGNLLAAEACFIQLLEQKPGTYFASVDPALHNYKTRHCLGIVYHGQGRIAEAVSQWQAVLAERADHQPTLVSLAELAIEQNQWDKLEELLGALDRIPGGAVESAVLRAQGHLARKEFDAAKHLLTETRDRFPRSIAPRIVLSHALLQEDRDLDGAENALREVLAMDPDHQPTRHNLRVLMTRRRALVGQRTH